MELTKERKLEIADRLIDYLFVKYGNRLLDPGLTFTAQMMEIPLEEFREFISPHLKRYLGTG